MSKKPQIKVPKKGGDLLVECLLKEGIKYIFGIPGGQLLTIYDAIYRWGKDEGIQTIMVRHEQAGAHAADAYARVTGNIGVCLGTVGPGVTDMVPGVGAAWADNTPLLVLGAQLRKKLDGKSCLQGDVDQLTLMKPITKAQFQIVTWEDIPKIIPEAIKTILSDRMGPVYVDIREDALIAEIPENAKYKILSPEIYHPKTEIPGDIILIEKAVELLKEAKKPIIVCGGEVNAYNASDEVKKLSEKYSIPAGATFTGIGSISSDISTYLGASLNSDSLTNAAMYSDMVISIGCKWDYSLAFGAPPLWPENQKHIQINIISSELGKNKPYDVGIVGDCKTVVKQLLEVMEKNLPKEKIEEWSQWNLEQQEYKKKQLKRYIKKYNSDKVPILPQRLVKDLIEFMPEDSIVVSDGGDIAVFAVEQIDSKPRPPRSILASVGMGHLGTGIPYALGAKIAFPDRIVIVLVGDGSFLFNVQELETAIRYNIPILVIIANNNSWGMIKSGQSISLGKRFIDSNFPEIDYAKIAEGFGCYAETVLKPEEIKPALQRALDSKKPAVIDVKIKWDIPKGTKLMLQLGLL
ncbi:MAG: thiamine pyrophosphate-binding protein [Promethearchaeota archaeon]